MKIRFFSEFIGTAFLLAVVVGSGIMGNNLAPGNPAVALLANSIATGAGLFVLIQSLGSVSGAHFNPVVSLVEFCSGRLLKRDLAFYWLAQFVGSIVGVLVTHLIFDLPILQMSKKTTAGWPLALSEFIATFGLIAVIAISSRKKGNWGPLTIAAYIVSAYWFTSSTSFANPAVTLARAFTNTFCGISIFSVPKYIFAQVFASLCAFRLVRSL